MDSNSFSDRTIRQVLALVGAAMWQTEVNNRLFADVRTDWESIGRLAERQTVVLAVIDGAMRLPSELRPPKEWTRRALLYTEGSRRTHKLVDDCVAESVRRLREEGVKTVLLKGQAYARCYPQSAMRQCGDIDLYVGERNYYDAYEISRRSGWKSNEEFKTNVKHYGCSLRGVRIELHRVAGRLPSKRMDRRFQEWSQSQLENSGRKCIIGGEEIVVPSAAFDVVFVFMHLYLHFINGGIGLRHLCDWAMILHANSDTIDRQELRERLDDFGLLRGWQTCAPIIVEELGLPAAECPMYAERFSRKSKRIFESVMRDGNFGKSAPVDNRRPGGYIGRKLHSLVRHSRKVALRFPIDPMMVGRFYVRFISNGIRRIITDVMKGFGI